MDELRIFTLILSLSSKVSYKMLLALLDKYGSLQQIFELFRKGKLKTLILANLDIDVLLKEFQKRNVNFICFWEDGYPTLLRECNDYPLVVYYVGNRDILCSKDFISIVGTRKITSYGKNILEDLIPQIKNNVVVSGMAFGVDAFTHKLALDSGLPTIAVLPASCDKPTPEGNKHLYNRILKDNLIISDVAPGISIHKGMYPRRNRIIAGLSQKTIVVEAGVKSGALITADLAFNYNRDVYAFPGSIYSSMSAGCNYLIKSNIAQLVVNGLDLGFNNSNNRFVEELNPIERKVYYAILPEPKSLNELSKYLEIDINILAGICTNLEINGILNTDNQNKFYVS